MTVFQIKEVKNFMSRLFQKNDFDQFLVREAEVQSACSYKINGHRNQGFYTKEELEELPDRDYLRWEEIKPQAFQMIRGLKTPLLLTVAFLARREELEAVAAVSGAERIKEEIAGAYMNLKFQTGELVLATGVGFRTFVPGKEFERAWDQHVKELLKEKGIEFDEIL